VLIIIAPNLDGMKMKLVDEYVLVPFVKEGIMGFG
jgi:hypothetical protein